MFLTDAMWRDSSPVKAAMVWPFEAWHVVGVAPLVPIFRIYFRGAHLGDEQYIRAYFVASVDQLLAIVDRLLPDLRAVMQVDMFHEERMECVREIWEIRSATGQFTRGFAFRNAEGQWIDGPVDDAEAMRCVAAF
ncbi:MAG: hypothetical protein CL858_11310 [Cupriavidus sp.]|nr:hypothetical protein [Cupriavidus sp.]